MDIIDIMIKIICTVKKLVIFICIKNILNLLKLHL